MVKDEEIMQALANQLGKVGIKVNLQFLESSVYTPRYANGEFDMAVNAWGKSLEADSVITGLRWLTENSKFYGNPQVDAAINKARATFGMPERTRVYQEADRLLREDAVGLFTHAQSELYGTNQPVPLAAVGLRRQRAGCSRTTSRRSDGRAGTGRRACAARRASCTCCGRLGQLVPTVLTVSLIAFVADPPERRSGLAPPDSRGDRGRAPCLP